MGAIAYVLDLNDFARLTKGVQRFYCIRTKEMSREVTLHLICTARKDDVIYVYEELDIVESPREYIERIKYFRRKILEIMPDAIVGFIAFDINQLKEELGFGESVAPLTS